MSSRVVAAIVPVYNRPRLVLEALDSVAAQTRRPDHLVIVDDGSTDDTPRRVDEWAASHRNLFPIEVALQSNGGAAKARNHGVTLAGDVRLLAFLDSDDLWPPDYLERMVSLLQADSNLVAATADRLDRVGNESPTLRRFDRLSKATARRLFVEGSPGTPNTVFRADAFREVDGYNEAMVTLEDFDLMLRLSLRGPWGHAPGAPVTVRRDFGDAAEARHLSRRDPEWRRRQAGVLETFLFEGGGRDVIPERSWKPRLAEVWYKAGRSFEKSSRPGDAVTCFSKALSYQPAHVKARLHRAALSRSIPNARETGKRP